MNILFFFRKMKQKMTGRNDREISYFAINIIDIYVTKYERPMLLHIND